MTAEVWRRLKSAPTPKGSPEATEAALAAALAAYANGRGQWPTMTGAARIACMEEFTRQIQARRIEVVRLIMWEVGKTLPDSEKEIRSHRRLHCRNHQCAQGTGQQQLPLCRRRRNDRPDSPHAAWRRPVHGPVQLSAKRIAAGLNPAVPSVASLFVSRWVSNVVGTDFAEAVGGGPQGNCQPHIEFPACSG